MEAEETYLNSCIGMNSGEANRIKFLSLLSDQGLECSKSLELEESDVIWSNSDYSPPISTSPTSSNYSNSPIQPHKFVHNGLGGLGLTLGLSAALPHDHHRPIIQRKPSLSAAKTIPRSSWSSSDEFSSSGKFHQSAPVNVPMWTRHGSNKSGLFEEVEDDDGGKEEEMLPPHEIVARSHVTTFSVFEGVGRTLKGRDLRRVRNAVFQKTGFLD